MTRDPDELRARRRASQAELQRRRVIALAIAAAVSVAGLVVAFLILNGGGGSSEGTSSSTLATPTLKPNQLAGQRLIAGFEGTRPPTGLERMIAAGELAGVILFADNVSSPGRTARMVAGLQAIERPDGLRAPLAVMVDQEGGQVRRVAGPPTASAAEMGRRGVEFARAQGEATAASLLGYGVNIDLAPVLDVARPGSAIEVEERSFGTDADAVTSVGVDGFAAGLRKGGVAPAAKHFPGLGAASTNTDFDAQTIDAPRSELKGIDQAPFAAFAEGDGELIMLGLATYPALADRPAAFSAKVATGELRERLGFTGVSITDSLDAAAALDFGGRDEVALAAVGAGTDLLLYGDWRTAESVNQVLSSRLESGKLDQSAFADSVRRVLALREDLALPPAG